jgi:MoaA/NifB/PqqE/SkfB family radical SAM enzyme
LRPLAANFYLTYRCNDSCEFCKTWQDETLQDTPEIGVDEIKKLLGELKELGVAYVDFTGGEPLLRDDVAEILKEAKEKKLHTSLTTNCLLYPERAKEITQYVDRLIFSLDSPVPEDHDRIRGEACFDSLIRSIPIAKSLGKSPVINFTVTRDTVRFLPETVFDYHGLEGFNRQTINYIKYYGGNKNVSFNLAALEFMSAFGNNTKRPRCRASQAVITVTPDGSLMLPCSKNKEGKIKLEGSIRETLSTNKELAKATGKMEMCSGCMAWPYMIPSFLYKIDKYFFLNLWSLFELYRKEYGLNKGGKK